MNRPQDTHGNYFIGTTSIGYMQDPLAPSEKLFSFNDIEDALASGASPCLVAMAASQAAWAHPHKIDSLYYEGTDVDLCAVTHDQFRYVTRNAPSLDGCECEEDDYDEDGECDCDPDDDMDYYARYGNIALLQHVLTTKPQPFWVMSRAQEKAFSRWVALLVDGQQVAA